MERKINIRERNLHVSGEGRRLIQRGQTSRTSTTYQIGDVSKHVGSNESFL